eukprot:6069789-Amphidinium_carterae.1
MEVMKPKKGVALLDWQAFGWYRLLPADSELKTTVQHVSGESVPLQGLVIYVGLPDFCMGKNEKEQDAFIKLGPLPPMKVSLDLPASFCLPLSFVRRRWGVLRLSGSDHKGDCMTVIFDNCAVQLCCYMFISVRSEEFVQYASTVSEQTSSWAGMLDVLTRTAEGHHDPDGPCALVYNCAEVVALTSFIEEVNLTLYFRFAELATASYDAPKKFDPTVIQTLGETMLHEARISRKDGRRLLLYQCVY